MTQGFGFMNFEYEGEPIFGVIRNHVTKLVYWGWKCGGHKKRAAWATLFIGFFWSDNNVFDIWAEITRVLSLIWLQAQSLLILDVAHDIHDIIITNADSEEAKTGDGRGWYALYLLIAISGLSCSGGKIFSLYYINYTI